MINFNVLDEVQDDTEPKANFDMIEVPEGIYAQGNATELTALLNENADLHFVSNGEFSLHELVEAILLRFGRAKQIVLSTFSFTELPARTLARFKDDGLLSAIYALVDVRAKANYPGVFQQLNLICDAVAIVPVHAKITILEFDTFSIIITGSANWTTNRRYEIGCISFNKQTVSFHKYWIMKAIKTKQDAGT